jgi:ubiquinone/menaquinone biosynthesis C-methylase UbiE
MNAEKVYNSLAERRKLICPWQLAPIIDNRLRPLIHNPQKLFAPYVSEGMTVLDVGCGAGFTSLGLAGLVGEKGKVIAADLQPRMLDMVKERAMKEGLADRVDTHLCERNSIGLQEKVDFVVAFFMVHEVPNVNSFLKEIYSLLKPGSQFFVTEPKIHVGLLAFQQIIQKSQAIGFTISDRPHVVFGRTVLLKKE